MSTSSVATVERLIPIKLVTAVVWHGVADRDDPEHAAVLRQLERAEHDELAGLARHRQDSAQRHATRASEALLAPFIAERMACAKFGLIVFYALQHLIDCGGYELREGPFSAAMDAVLNPEGTVTELANIDGIDASAQKRRRQLLRALQGLGYFQNALVEAA